MNSFFFYDLETSGLNPRFDRIMQFAGIRTDENLKQIGGPINILVKLSEDILPSPEALLVTGITPQKTISEGISEHEFARFLTDKVFTPNTVMIGYNNISFDDEFVRHTLWRNFHDPYEWSWSMGRSRWDLLDIVRLTRALRPEDINWPTINGKSVNKLELLAKENNIEQEHAHDALSDVEALIGLTKMIRNKQPRLFEYLFKMRNKNEIAKLINLNEPKPFVFINGRSNYPEKATVGFPIAPGNKPNSTLIYDLRVDPNSIDFKNISSESIWKDLPIQELMYNRCPAVAPLSVLDDKSQKRLELPLSMVHENIDKLIKNQSTVDKLVDIWRKRPDYPKANDVEAQLYEGFTIEEDKPLIKSVRESSAEQLADFHPVFKDERLDNLLLRYKAREFPESLSEDEQKIWQQYILDKYQKQLPILNGKLIELSKSSKNQFILDEINLWLEANMPIND